MKILFMGCGSIGLRHIRLLKELRDDVEIYAYRTTQNNSELLKDFGVRCYSSLETALQEDFDAAFITNPTSLHVESIFKIKDKIKNIFVEKPLSNSCAGIPELEKSSNVFLIGYVFRYHPLILKVKELLDNGEIGRVLYGEASVGQYLPTWRPGTDYRQSVSAKKKLGGGAILELSHELDYLCWFMGRPSEVFSYSGHLSELEIETEDLSEILLSFKDGMLGRIHLDFLQRKASRGGKLIGTNGDILFDIIEGTIDLNAEQKKKFKFNVERDEAYALQLRHFLDVIEGKSEPSVPLQDGISALELALAAKESADKNMPVQLKEVNE